MQLESKGLKVRDEEEDLGLTERIVFAMASEMAASLRATEKSCVLFRALAKSVGINVENAFADTE